MISNAYSVVTALLSSATALPKNGGRADTRLTDNTWDYVIVAGGATGLVVANRLTEDSNKTVLVIEAGAADDNPNIRMPYAASHPVNTSHLWGFKSEPEPEIGDRTFDAKAARVLGGGSIVNGLMYDRAAAADYDAWEALENKGWGWEGLFPFTKKSTEFIEPSKETTEEFEITWDSEVGDNGDAYGTAWFPNSMNPLTGERSHARNSYYEPVSQRSNLNVVLETLATEIVFDGDNLTATGVKTTDKTNSTSIVYARKEVILAAGALNTPKLLQLSGIGPQSVLEAAGIPVKLSHDDVGANFQDHPYTNLLFNVSNMSKPNPTFWNDPAFNASAWAQYQANKTGPLIMARGNSLAFIPLQDIDPEQYSLIAESVLSPSNEAYLPPLYQHSQKLLRGFSTQRDILATLYSSKKSAVAEFPITSSPAVQIIDLEKPISRGTVTINPDNPHGAPRVFYNDFSNSIDKTVLASCVRYIRKLLSQPNLSKFSLVETSPGLEYTTDEAILEKAIKSRSLWPTLSHSSGTCAMMPEEMGGCVSDELLFYGVERLSVVDASIIPLVPAQHLQATMYAVGEKAASIIQQRGGEEGG
ncbi:hypothetical protein yc1106_02421 [Curvularia clavata]|uniref:Glucose-methanol-choline oxidoreductase N-terminal domain-containing protein n=1 Tax=Curvularia clavata TaxID=95742 RepID=A0A9Q8Z2S7_CURCL|nr:hypothetical protein yc1106_02421 [Curvularia clavata]